jgi:hypothetical protein
MKIHISVRPTDENPRKEPTEERAPARYGILIALAGMLLISIAVLLGWPWY